MSTITRMSTNKLAIAAASAMAATFMISTGAQAHSPGKSGVVCNWKGCTKLKSHRHVGAKRIVVRKLAKRTLMRKLAKRLSNRKRQITHKRFKKPVKSIRQRRHR